mmetsp:Transcript_1748/g.5238  ORF Transcript_1748/g.5238 Transcript_1748/m.5238 type:complete len:210 (-) Transcript_1748:655-1284(-)
MPWARSKTPRTRRASATCSTPTASLSSGMPWASLRCSWPRLPKGACPTFPRSLRTASSRRGPLRSSRCCPRASRSTSSRLRPWSGSTLRSSSPALRPRSRTCSPTFCKSLGSRTSLRGTWTPPLVFLTPANPRLSPSTAARTRARARARARAARERRAKAAARTGKAGRARTGVTERAQTVVMERARMAATEQAAACRCTPPQWAWGCK